MVGKLRGKELIQKVNELDHIRRYYREHNKIMAVDRTTGYVGSISTAEVQRHLEFLVLLRGDNNNDG